MSAAAGCVPAAARPTASAPGSLRSGLMSMIRARARALGVDPDRMRELMLRATGKESCGGMSADELGRVLTELNRTRGMRLRLPAGPHTARLRALWLSAWHLGVVPDRSDAALMRFAKRVSGFDAARPERGAEKAVEAIKAWLARAAKVDWRPYAAVDADGRRCEIHHPRARVLEAQWRILAGLGEVEIADRQALSSYAARHARIAARISHTQLGADAADALIRHFGRRIRPAHPGGAQAANGVVTPANAPLPGILAEVSEVAGRDAAIALAISLGGREIYIPPPEWIIEASDHPLIAATGPQAAARIAGRLSPDRVYVPRARQAAAVWLAGQGLTTAEIAVRLGISRRTARRYRRAVLF